MSSLKVMYRCEQCGKQVLANIPAMRRVVETREVEYTKEVPGKHKGTTRTIVIGQGIERVKEVKLCHECFGVDTPPPPKPVYCDSLFREEPEGDFTLTLANGKTVTSNSGFELDCFLASAGSSITPPTKKKKKKGKAKPKKKEATKSDA